MNKPDWRDDEEERQALRAELADLVQRHLEHKGLLTELLNTMGGVLCIYAHDEERLNQGVNIAQRGLREFAAWHWAGMKAAGVIK